MDRVEPTLLTRLRRTKWLLLFVALLVVAKSVIACSCGPLDLLQDQRVDFAGAVRVASVALGNAPDRDQSLSMQSAGCRHCCCQQPSVPPLAFHLVKQVVPPASRLCLPTPGTSSWAAGPFRPPISKYAVWIGPRLARAWKRL